MTRRGEAHLPASGAEVHYWTVPLTAAPPADAFGILSPEEQHRAGRFAAGRLRERYIASHAALRQILGSYTAEAPEAVRICAEPRGRPRLAGSERSGAGFEAWGQAPIDFSFTHTRDLALVVLARGLRLGVDLESGDRRIRIEELAPHVLCSSELDWLAQAPGTERRSRFLRLWTAKEALLKATGWGLYLDPQKVRVDWPKRRGEVHPGFPPTDSSPDASPAPCERQAHGSPAPSRWHLQELDLPPQWVATLASDRAVDTLAASRFCWSQRAKS